MDIFPTTATNDNNNNLSSSEPSRIYDLSNKRKWSELLLALPTATIDELQYKNEYGSGIFHNTCQNRPPVQVIEALIAKGFSPNECNEQNGWTPLNYASYYGIAPEAMKILLANDGNPNLAAKSGWTPLRSACEGTGSSELVMLLLQAGADYNSGNDLDKPIAVAQNKHRTDLVEILSNWPPPKAVTFNT
jgi:ankyrin repeat protein